MHQERHDACGEDIVLHVGIPRCPQTLENIQMHIVLGHFVELTPVSVRRRREKGGR